jgi:hypothetical protein
MSLQPVFSQKPQPNTTDDPKNCYRANSKKMTVVTMEIPDPSLAFLLIVLAPAATAQYLLHDRSEPVKVESEHEQLLQIRESRQHIKVTRTNLIPANLTYRSLLRLMTARLRQVFLIVHMWIDIGISVFYFALRPACAEIHGPYLS